MADNKATKAGNWTDTTVWSLGRVPDGTDDVYLNGFAVTINTTNFNITVGTLRNTIGTGIVAAGYLPVNSAGTFTATNGFYMAGAYMFYFTDTVNLYNVNIYGNLVSQTAGTAFIANSSYYTVRFYGDVTMISGVCIVHTGGLFGKTYYSGHTIMNGGTFASCTSGNLYIADTTTAVINAGTNYLSIGGGVTTITGDVYQTFPADNQIYMTNGTLNIIGNVYGSKTATGAKPYKLIYNVAASGILNITGNIYTYDVNYGVYGLILNNGIVNLTGNAYGGQADSSMAMTFNGANAALYITGDMYGSSTNNNAYVLSDKGNACTLDVTGNIYSQVSTAALMSALGSVVKARGNMVSLNGMNPVCCHKLLVSPTAGQYIQLKDTGLTASRTFSTSNATGGIPSTSDVRYGTVFGAASEYTGTLRVPAAGSVAYGVLTDNTTGTAILTADAVQTAVWNTAAAGLITDGSIGQLLKNAATVASVGDQIAAMNP